MRGEPKSLARAEMSTVIVPAPRKSHLKNVAKGSLTIMPLNIAVGRAG